MIKKKIIIMVTFVIVVVSLFTGCSLKGDVIIPEEVITNVMKANEKPKSYYAEFKMDSYENEKLKDSMLFKQWNDNSSGKIKTRIETEDKTSGKVITTNDGNKLISYTEKDKKAFSIKIGAELDLSSNANYKDQLISQLGNVSKTHRVTFKGEAIASIMKEHLVKEGYEVFWASTGKEGLEDFKREQFQLVMVDIMLPEMDGFTLCKNIRWLDEEVSIIIVSAKQTDSDKVKGLKLGADDYITKPFSLMEISARIEAHLRRPRKKENFTPLDRKLEFKKGLIIIPEDNRVIFKEHEIFLTLKEFEILFLMAQNPNKVFSKQEIYQHIWENIDVMGNNTVTVHIKELREKIKDNIKNPTFIQTVWGTGYKFIGERSI